MFDDQVGHEWVSVSSGTGLPGLSRTKAVKRLCVCMRQHWYGHVLWKEDDDWVKKCMEYEVEGPRPRGRPKKIWGEVVKEDCQAHKLNTDDTMDRSKWRKLIKDVRWPGWVWAGLFLLVLAYPGSPGPTAVKRSCVCVCDYCEHKGNMIFCTGYLSHKLMNFKFSPQKLGCTFWRNCYISHELNGNICS